ncbi:TRAFAC clade GTPase domain-containing protein [Paenibacillus chitinolyticus]|uniref:TRAFAC clade GTPase domain-containing protein n=1 Tax=Paenibacillus chitinolyticus TaxID=79263 RepID=UPI00366BAE1E
MLGYLKSLFEKKPPEKERPPYYSIVCPYCFNKFEPDDVVFRATHIKDSDDDFMLQEDERLNSWRRKFNLSEVDMEAVILPSTIPDSYKTYVQNVLVAVTDRYGETTRRRLCPYCHNELPISAGKVPSNIISIVGASQVGKSVYMTSLIHTLQHTTASNFNAACMPLSAEISRKFRQHYHEPIFERGSMLQSTNPNEQQEPFIFQFVFKDEREAPLTIVFFDVAGEGMVQREYLDIYASHIKNSSGILFLVDPLQIRSIRDKIQINVGGEQGEFANRYDEPREVVISLFENFIAHQSNSKTDIPTAIVLTKSDMLQYLKEEDSEYIQPNSNVFRNVVHQGYLDASEFENINGEIGRFIEKVDRPFKDAVDVYFSNTAYFAVSALGTNPVNKQISGVINPTRVDEPFIWLLHKLGYIARRDAT